MAAAFGLPFLFGESFSPQRHRDTEHGLSGLSRDLAVGATGVLARSPRIRTTGEDARLLFE